MPARLVAIGVEDGSGAIIVVDRPVLLIGRHAECDIQLHSSKVSRQHCCIAEVPASASEPQPCLAIRDLGSTNGIRVNGQRVEASRLRHGDELMIGNLRFRVEWDDAPASTQKPIVLGRDPLISCDLPIPILEPKSTSGPLSSSQTSRRADKG